MILKIPLLLVGMCMWLSVNSQTYVEMADALGVEHTYGYGIFGGGLSFFDFNEDGWDDLSLSTEAGDTVRFFQNTGDGFVPVVLPGIDHDGHSKQILWADYDNDYDPDVLITGKDGQNVLYVNTGNLTFTPQVLPPPPLVATNNTYGAIFGDYDTDGDLDLFLCNYVGGESIPNQFLQNNGDGTFTDLTLFSPFSNFYQLTFCAGFIDYNNDLLPDLYTAEDRHFTNRLYTNMGDGFLLDACFDCGAEIVVDAMSVCPGDYDNDGDEDIYVTNTWPGNVLLNNQGDGTFTNVAELAGVEMFQVAWGASFFDMDLDGDLDLFVCASNEFKALPDALYRNLGDGTFSQPTGLGFDGDSTKVFSHAMGDVNNDGYYDIAAVAIDPDATKIWISEGGNANNWLKIKLEGTQSNTDGIGSWIELWINGQKQVHYTNCGTGYLAQNSNMILFGMGTSLMADSVVVRWPSGMEDIYVNIVANQLVHLVEGNPLTSVFRSSGLELSVYPSPFTTQLQAALNPAQPADFYLYSMNGQLADQHFSLTGNVQFDRLDQLSPGIYFLVVETSKGKLVRKVVRN